MIASIATRPRILGLFDFKKYQLDDPPIVIVEVASDLLIRFDRSLFHLGASSLVRHWIAARELCILSRDFRSRLSNLQFVDSLTWDWLSKLFHFTATKIISPKNALLRPLSKLMGLQVQDYKDNLSNRAVQLSPEVQDQPDLFCLRTIFVPPDTGMPSFPASS